MTCKERGCRTKTPNAQRSTLNVQRPTSNVQFRKSFMLALLIMILIDLTSDSDCYAPCSRRLSESGSCRVYHSAGGPGKCAAFDFV
jgi:hypothetical protein